jgi:acyl carrier protein
MNKQDYIKLNMIFSKVFKDHILNLTYDDINTNKVSSWDSLAQLDLILTIEDQFNIKFETSKISDLTSFTLIANEIDKIRGK